MKFSGFIKINPSSYPGVEKIFNKMEGLCCERRDCHSHTLTYHSSNPNVLIFTNFHKGSFIYNLKYNVRKKQLNFKHQDENCHLWVGSSGWGDCHIYGKKEFETDLVKLRPMIKKFIKNTFLPLYFAYFSGKHWNTTKNILKSQTPLYNDVLGIIKDYTCKFKYCEDCQKIIEEKWNKCWTCYKCKCGREDLKCIK